MTQARATGPVHSQSRHRACLGVLLLLAAAASPVPRAAAQAAAEKEWTPVLRSFALEDVVKRARDLAAQPFDQSGTRLPPGLDRLDYEHYRRIVFRRDRSLLADRSRFALQLMHRGFTHERPVVVNMVRDNMVSPIPYSAGLFDYGGVKFDRGFPINLGFAGLRILYPLQTPQRQDEAISFLGATGFRFLGRGDVYGLTAEAFAGEDGEAPFFREMWVRQPERDGDRIEVYGLADSPAATGAFRFDVVPGERTAVEVSATIFARRTTAKIALAPLISMFLAGENDREARDDFRPEVHDSDGVLIHNGNDEWMWRPLHNPHAARTSQFVDTDPRGFGLVQRDRAFDHYGDLEARFEQRPSYWIEPLGKWGKGSVALVERPAAREGENNVALSWRPEAPLAAGSRLELHYRMTSIDAGADLHGLARTAATYETAPDAGKTGRPAPPTLRRFLVDFTGGDLAYYLGDPSLVTVDASTSVGRVKAATALPNAALRGFRAAVDLEVEAGRTADVRVVLRAAGRVLTETWTYGWTSPAVPAGKAAGAH